jgi:hypothetical protein
MLHTSMREQSKGSYESLKAQTMRGSRVADGTDTLTSKIPRDYGIDPWDANGYGCHSQEMTTTECVFMDMAMTGLRSWFCAWTTLGRYPEDSKYQAVL